jgi:hypothetical protein
VTLRTLGSATALALAVALAVTTGAASAADEVVSAEAFLARVDNARGLALAASSDPSAFAMRRVRAALGLPVTVEVSGTRVWIETDPFLGALDGSNADDFDRAVAHLDRLAAAAREADAATPPDRAAIDDAVRRALVGVARPTAVDTLRAYVYAAIGKVLSLVVEPLREFRGVRSVLAWAVVATLLAGIVFLLRRQGLGLVPDRSAARSGDGRELDWDRVAEDALRRGDLREATRALYHVLLRSLAFRGIVPIGTSTTAGECRAAVAAKLPATYDAVARGTNAFERVAYGGAAASQADVEALRDAAREVAA